VIDLKLVRDQPDQVRAALARRGEKAAAVVDRLAELDRRRRALVVEVDNLRAEQKQGGKQVAKASAEERPEILAGLKELAGRLDRAEAELREVEEQLAGVQATVPNLPDQAAPDGGEEDSVELRQVGVRPEFDFEVRDHLQLGELLGAIDTARAAKVSGARFGYLTGPGAMLEFSLVRFAIDRLSAAGFTPMIPPVLVRREAMFGTGFLPTDEQQIFRTADDDLYLVGTSEVPLVGYHADEILDPRDLPTRYVGYSTCFRREAGSYGKDTRGIFRVHQFDKVEMVSFVEPGRSGDEHAYLLAQEEAILQALEIPYRVVDIAVGDLGGSAARKFDCEAWIPSQGTWRELTSTSNCTDYQARRSGIRFKGEHGNEPVHTLNGTAVAVGRTIIALLENHQQADGSVRIPEALAPYLGTEVLTPLKA
jgi:seryl-tRNA synthetase